MKNLWTRPGSQQKERGNDDESSPREKEQNQLKSTDTNVDNKKSMGKVLSAMRVKSAKSGKSITKLIKGEESSIELTRQKSRIKSGRIKSGRVKSGRMLSENTKNQVLKKFKGSRRDAKVEPKEEEAPKQEKQLIVWDSNLEQLSLSKKTLEMIDKEIGLRYIRVLPSTPDNYYVGVKKIKQQQKQKVFAVVRPASLSALPVSDSLLGARYDNEGRIVPHSILGDVDDFIRYASVYQCPAHTVPDAGVVKPVPDVDSTRGSVYEPHVNEKNALRTYRTEMNCRKHTQKQLAGMLHRPVDDLLMYKSDSYNTKGERIRFIQHHSEEYHPDMCFWRLPAHVGDSELTETIYKSHRGYLPSPVVSGDADCVREEKGKTTKHTVCNWEQTEYSQNRIRDTEGTIKISNNVLFAELDLHGVSVSSQHKQNTVNEMGDNPDCTKGVHFMIDQGPASTDGTEPVPESRQKYRSIWRELLNTGTDKFVHKYTKCDSTEVKVPALLIDNTLLQWRNTQDQCNHSNVTTRDNDVIKEVFVPIKASVNEVVKVFAKIENCGNTVIRYCWMKVPTPRTLPIPRPTRRYFYFLDNDGVILPKETIYVPMLFRSKTPGYFTESWLLNTVPLLENGQKVKFTFKGVAVYMPDYSQQINDIETYLHRKQVETLCTSTIQSVVDHAALTASLNLTKLTEEIDPPSVQDLFIQLNPTLHYHGNIVRKLQELENRLSAKSSSQGAVEPQPEQSLDAQTPSAVCVVQLYKTLQALPDNNDDEDGDIDSESVTSQTTDLNKERLLYQLHNDLAELAFAPFVRIESGFQYKYNIMYTLLQNMVDQFVGYTATIATMYDLVYKEEPKDQIEPKKTTKSSKAKNRGKTGKKASGSPDVQAAVSTVAVSPDDTCEVPVFSAVHKYRKQCAEKKDREKCGSRLALYDEKCYTEMYSMLSTTLDLMSDVFIDS